MAQLVIRPAAEADFERIWEIFHAVVQPGDSYVFSPDATREDARVYWFSPDFKTFVVTVEGVVAGMYKLRPNETGLGSHVSNASFMVDPAYRGLGLGEQMGRHCLAEAQRVGYRAMQFNFVVSTNTPAVKLWQKLGFEVVGVLPQAFRHAALGLVDVYVMYRLLA